MIKITRLTWEIEAGGRPAVRCEHLRLMKGGHAGDGRPHPVGGGNNPAEEQEEEHCVSCGQLEDGGRNVGCRGVRTEL